MIARTAHDAEHLYLVISKRAVEDKQLSFKARGMLAYLLSKPDGWEVRMSELEGASLLDGRKAIMSGLKELQDCGYFVRERPRASNGSYVTGLTFVYEDPQVTPQTQKGIVATNRTNGKRPQTQKGTVDATSTNETKPQVAPQVHKQPVAKGSLSSTEEVSNQSSINRTDDDDDSLLAEVVDLIAQRRYSKCNARGEIKKSSSKQAWVDTARSNLVRDDEHELRRLIADNDSDAQRVCDLFEPNNESGQAAVTTPRPQQRPIVCWICNDIHPPYQDECGPVREVVKVEL